MLEEQEQSIISEKNFSSSDENDKIATLIHADLIFENLEFQWRFH